jgi:hypothetical protein
VRDLCPDRHFDAEQRQRLEALMARWRAARDSGTELPEADRDELRRLTEDEVRAATERAAELLRSARVS